MTRLLLVIFFALLLYACSSRQPDSVASTDDGHSPANAFVSNLEAAHHLVDFKSHDAVQFDLSLFFGGKQRLLGKVTLATDSGKARIDLDDTTSMIVDGQTVYYTPSMNPRRVRFDAYTWSYFFLLPYKLSDPGTRWTDYPDKQLNGKAYEVQQLEFEAGTGDAPDDWYIVYADSNTNLIHAAAYIVTVGKSREEAEEDPHAIVYGDYTMVEGVPIARSWTFTGYTKADGLTDTLGSAQLTDLKFVDDLPDDFYSASDQMATAIE